ncbi:MAG TPA: MmgE/PrpD family protein, partial [Burkholderiaceae bacterium]|nr:MmgE/PrpD family protein [Burkholderiaceae bacterium]
GTGAATVIGTSNKVPAPWAAMINGTAAHVLEIDDNFYPALTHASAILVPALIALGEEVDASGADLLDAFIVGLELHAVLGRGVNRSHYFAGWHPTATVGCIGTAGACARLLKLDQASTVATMSLAVSMASGNKAQFGTEAKSFQCGMGASNAIIAATLGAAGLQGNPQALEDPQGFLTLYGGPAPRGWDEPLKKLDKPLALEEFGLAPKRHACCGSAHNTLDCLLDLKKEHGFSAEDVQSVEVLVGASNKKNLRYAHPEDEFQARFSLNYNVALILLQGSVGLADFTPEAVHRESVRRLLGLTTMRARAFVDEPSDPDQRPPHIVKLTLKNGKVLEAQRIHARGLIQDPFNDQERLEKIEQCCVPRMSPQAYATLLSQLGCFRTLGSIRSLTAVWAR